MEQLETLEREYPQDDERSDTAQAAGWQLQLLGTWDLQFDGRHVHVPRSAQRLITALVLLDARPRAYLSGLLWPDSSDEQAAGNLRNCVWRISHDFPGLLSASKDPLALSPGVRVDTRLLAAALDSDGAFPGPPYAKETIEVLGRAELLPGWYEDWVMHSQERIRELRINALERMAELSLGAAQVATATDAALAAVAVDPLRESAHRLLIQSHLAAGNRASAHRAYSKLQSRLNEELGIPPSPELESLILAPQSPV